MLVPMTPPDAVFLYAETREQPMHVGGLQVFEPAPGMVRDDILDLFQSMLGSHDVAPLFGRRPRRSVLTGLQWGWERDEHFDIGHHVRHNALPRPGRVLELLALCSRLHSTLLDRHRPLWEVYLIEGLADGRFAVYNKIHHSMSDGVSAMRLMRSGLSEDPYSRDSTPPWSPPVQQQPAADTSDNSLENKVESARDALRGLTGSLRELAGLPVVLARSANLAAQARGGPLAFTAPRSMFNVPITGARRVAAQSWPIERIRTLAHAAGCSLNDVVLAMCSGALRRYLLGFNALPASPLIALVPVSLRGDDSTIGGNAVGSVMCSLATDVTDPALRLQRIVSSMHEGKQALAAMSRLQILAMTALAMSPLGIDPLLHSAGLHRPPFNLIISNVPGPRHQLYWNGARMSGLYPLSIPIHGQALNISCVSHSDQLSFGLTGCRSTVPSLQRMLAHLEDELAALETALR